MIHAPAVAVAERRRETRVPVAAAAWLDDQGARCAGQAVDASLRGLMIEVREPPPLLAGREVVVTLALPRCGPVAGHGTIVRHERGGGWGVRLGIRLCEPLHAPATSAVGAEWPARRAPGARPRGIAAAELCALGTCALELAALDPGAPVPASLADWLDDLAEELGAGPPSPPATAGGLVDAVAAVAAGR